MHVQVYEVAVAAPRACEAFDLVCLADAHTGVAGFLQAIGAIVIVFVAYQEGRRQVWAQEAAFAKLCRSVGRDLFSELLPVLDWCQGRAAWKNEFENLRAFYASPANDTLRRVLELPLDRWPSLDLYNALRSVQHSIAALRDDLDASIAESGNLTPTAVTTERARSIYLKLAAIKAVTEPYLHQGWLRALIDRFRRPFIRRHITKLAVRLFREEIDKELKVGDSS